MNTWGFGQVVPIVLLALPLLASVEYFSGFKGGQSDLITKTIIHAADPRHASSAHRVNVEPQQNGEEHDSPQLYGFPWFSGTVFLIYLLSIAPAADVLYTFPYGEGFARFSDNFAGLSQSYLAWIGVGLCLLGIFVFVNLVMGDVEPGCETLESVFRQWRVYKPPMFWMWSSVLLFFALSVIYNGLSYKYDYYG
ncbi:hypothetical protein ACLMJK_002895 [Lecanora helva]